MGQTETNLSKNFVKELSKQSREFCIIGLVGKIRSGTSDVCSLLTMPDFTGLMDLPAVYQEESAPDARDYRIIFRYLRENWKPFVELSVTSVIVSFLLDLTPKELEALPSPSRKSDESVGTSIYRILEQQCTGEQLKDFKRAVLSKAVLADAILRRPSNTQKTCVVDSPNPLLKKSYDNFFSKDLTCEKFFSEWKKIKQRLNGAEAAPNAPSNARDNINESCYDDFFFCFGVLPVLEDALKTGLKGDDKYPLAFQNFGNNIRATGSVTGISSDDSFKIEAKNLFALPKRVNSFIKLLRRYPLIVPSETEAESEKSAAQRSPVYVVINNFKNIFEAYYFKRRYSAFYLMAVSCDEAMRRDKFETRANYTLANLREDLSSGKKIFKATTESKCFNKGATPKDEESFQNLLNSYKEELGNNEAILEFIVQIFYSNDKLRKFSYDKNLAPFILQDVVTCIENADIFVTRDYQEPNWQYDQQLIRQIGRIMTLILHPGLLTPTRIERCMQVAMTAKLNSGCLSRQVGAVVTDMHYNILSLGWNDAPCGAESCLRRNFFDLARKSDKSAYSDYELGDEAFRNYVATAKKVLGSRMKELGGLPLAFCFKDMHQDLIMQRDQIYTRALHGEERALAACDNERAKGGYLFTTSSPCELCAKRAKEAGISKIYYIEQYPGISRSHIICVGPEETRSEYVSFVGAVGLAYNKLYTPLIPYKDELAALDFSITGAYRSAQDDSKSKSQPERRSNPEGEDSTSSQPKRTRPRGRSHQDQQSGQ